MFKISTFSLLPAILIYSTLVSAANFDCLKVLSELLANSNNLSREQILSNAVNGVIAKDKHHGVELKAKIPNEKELDEQLQNLVQHSGFYPRILDNKDVLERGEIFIAYPLNILENDLRLVMEYRTSIGNVNTGSKTEAYINKMYISDRFGEKVPLIDKMVKPEKLTESFRIVPKSMSAKKSYTLKELNDEVISNLSKDLEKSSMAEQNIRKQLIDDLTTIADSKNLSDIDKEMNRFNLILKNVSAEQSEILSRLIVNKDKIVFYPKLGDDILKKYNYFMNDFFYSPYKNSKAIRTQERLQQIKTVKDLIIYKKLIASENFKNWLLDRTGRHIGSIPVGLLVGGLSAYIVKKSGKKDKDKNKDGEDFDFHDVASNGSQATITLFHGKKKIRLLIFKNENSVNRSENEDENLYIIPDDQKNPLWKKSSVTLRTDKNEPVKFSVHLAVNNGQKLIYLIKE